MIPWVNVRLRPNGLPIAYTVWPTSRSSDEPTTIGLRRSPGASIWTTARSLSGATPTRRAFHADWSASVTRTVAEGLIVTTPAEVTWRALATTWKLVTTRPWSSHTNP